MRAVVQRVSRAGVMVDGRTVAGIGEGVLVLLAVQKADSGDAARWLADKCAELRIFNDESGALNRSLLDTGGAALVVSQFTLYGVCRRGRRPSFSRAAGGEEAAPLYEEFCRRMESHGVSVGRGEFGARMQVELVNDGPVTLLLESPEGRSEAVGE
jgi:D-tyrosyl-tRNA(Tyr) deacylase